MKPQIATPFLLWALFARRLRTLAVAMSVVVVGLCVYCLRIQANPVGVIAAYGAIVRRYYVGDAIMIGLAQPRPLIQLMTTNVRVVDAVTVGVALVTLAMVCAVGIAEAKLTRRVRYAAPALAGVWSLLTFYHLTYGFLVLLPLAVMLLFDEDASTLTIRRRLFWALQLCMMADLTVLWRWFGHLMPFAPAVGATVAHADRVIMLALFACVVALALRSLRAGPAPAQAAL